MFFDETSQIPSIASRTGTTVFVLPENEAVDIPGAIVLRPEDKTRITIEQVRAVMARVDLHQFGEQFVLIRPADKMSLEAANAFLKTLEEPRDKVHFVLVTDAASRLLPTILSRAFVYYFRGTGFSMSISADDETKQLAKRLIAAKPSEMVNLAEEIAKKKSQARAQALLVVGTAIEMLYKSYFVTSKDVFVKKLPKFVTAYENIMNNGHVKLHLIADLV